MGAAAARLPGQLPQPSGDLRLHHRLGPPHRGEPAQAYPRHRRLGAFRRGDRRRPRRRRIGDDQLAHGLVIGIAVLLFLLQMGRAEASSPGCSLSGWERPRRMPSARRGRSQRWSSRPLAVGPARPCRSRRRGQVGEVPRGLPPLALPAVRQPSVALTSCPPRRLDQCHRLRRVGLGRPDAGGQAAPADRRQPGTGRPRRGQRRRRRHGRLSGHRRLRALDRELRRRRAHAPGRRAHRRTASP